MNLFRSAIFALSVALMLPFGSSAVATKSDTPPPPLGADLNSRTLDLRETASRLVVETIEDVLLTGGLALLGEGFQIDSSLSFGTEIQGEIDAVVPLWSEAGKNGYTGVVFAQPGLALWTGLADEGRIDTNLGVVYRSNLLDALTGIDVISGASIFYDSNFRRGHSRISLGVDAQHREFHGGVNYYQPVSDEVDGRTGYIEDAVRGIDARLEFQRDIMRVSGNLGFWRYDGIGKSDWKSSYGLDAGVQVSEGIFIEGGYEKHDDDTSIGDRLSLGVAFKYSLPDLEGRSYGDNSMSSNLYQIVERERRILYEERVAVTGPRVSIVRIGSEAVIEGGTVSMDIRLSEELEENVTIHLVGSGSATYNDDYTVSVDGTDCPMVTEDNCRVSITAGQLTPSEDVVITINDDGRTNEPDESIVLSMVIASPANTDLQPRGSFSLTIPRDPPLPSVSIVRTGSEAVIEGGTVSMDIRLSEELEENVTINLVGSGTAEYGSSKDYTVSVGSTDCSMVTEANCQVTITAGQLTPSGDVRIAIIDDGRIGEPDESIILSVVVASPANTNLQPLGPLTLTIPADLPAPSVSLSATSMSIAEGGNATLTATLTETVTEPVVINLLEGGAADYGTGMDWHLNNGSDCSTATGTSCQITITAGQRSATATVNVNNDTNNETSAETFTVSIDVASAGLTGVIVGSPSSLTFTIPAESALPTVSLSRTNTGMDTAEGGTETLTLTLSGTLTGNATFNLIAGGTEAAYGTSTSNDWNLSVGGTDCDMATRSTPCQVMIPRGQTTGEAIVEVNTDTTTEGREEFTVSVEIDSGSNSIVALGSPSSLSFAIEATQHTVSFSSATGTAEEEGDNAIVTLNISPGSFGPVDIPLTITGDTVAYQINLGTSAVGNGVTFQNNVISIPDTSSGVGAISIIQFAFSVPNDDGNTTDETVTVSLGTLPDNYTAGTPNTWTVTVDDDDEPLPTASLKYSGSTTVPATSDARLQIELSNAASQDVKVEIVGSGDFDTRYGNDGSRTWDVSYNIIPEGMSLPANFTGGTPCNNVVDPDVCKVSIPARQTVVDMKVSFRFTAEDQGKSIAIGFRIGSESMSMVTLGSPSRHNFTFE